MYLTIIIPIAVLVLLILALVFVTKYKAEQYDKQKKNI